MNQKTIPKNKLGDSTSKLLRGAPYRRFSLPSTANSKTRAKFQFFLHKFKADKKLYVTKVEPYLSEEVAYIVTPKSEEAAVIRASYLVKKTFQKAYARRRAITERRFRTR